MKVNINGVSKAILAVWFADTQVKLIDQRKIPETIEIYSAKNSGDIYYAIARFMSLFFMKCPAALSAIIE